jgi:hypothetical protein
MTGLSQGQTTRSRPAGIKRTAQAYAHHGTGLMREQGQRPAREACERLQVGGYTIDGAHLHASWIAAGPGTGFAYGSGPSSGALATAADGSTVRFAPVLFQPIAGDEVAQALGRVAPGTAAILGEINYRW